VVALLVPAGEPVTVAIDDTLFRRRGKKVWAASWFHDGSAPGPAKTGYGNNWVIVAIPVPDARNAGRNAIRAGRAVAEDGPVIRDRRMAWGIAVRPSARVAAMIGVRGWCEGISSAGLPRPPPAGPRG